MSIAYMGITKMDNASMDYANADDASMDYANTNNVNADYTNTDYASMNPKDNSAISAVILCGGRSSRMGTDKALLTLGGESFLDIQINKLRSLGIDDIMLMPMKKEESVAFFNLINTLHEKTSVIITTNKAPTEWVEILHDEVLATALLDRLLYRCDVVKLSGSSYRMEHRSSFLSGAKKGKEEAV